METNSRPGHIYFAPGWSGLSEGFLLEHPVRIIRTDTLDDVPRLLREAAQEATAGRIAAGFISYEAGAAFETATPARGADLPLLWMGIYEGRTSRKGRIESPFAIRDALFSLTPGEYAERIEAIRSLIREGDVYQINFTGSVDFKLDGSGEDLFAHLLQKQYVPYAAYLDTGTMEVLSLSPELFFERRADRMLTRPMKGTVRRGESAAEDRRLEEWLSKDEKSRAENLMIVDLLRNDLSRVCIPGSVVVPSLFVTERYETLIQMTSAVEGRLRPDVGTADVFEALFPCGSITGAPKIRAMQVIHEMEEAPRGVYCGAVGFMEGDTAVFNVAIRTAVIREGRGRLGIGSGIVWDSSPQAEYDECLLKARFLTDVVAEDFRLIETMRWENGRIDLLDLHLNRLEKSAREFGFPVDRSEIEGQIHERTRGLVGERRKVRVTLGRRGDIELRISPTERTPAFWKVTVSGDEIDSEDIFRRHKTTRRAPYESAFRAAREAGFDEVLFFNTRRELVEGSRTNVIVVRDGVWYTPPQESGALPGVFRAHLLRAGTDLRERVLYIDDLFEASDIFLCNAVVGLVRARVVSEPVDAAGR